MVADSTSSVYGSYAILSFLILSLFFFLFPILHK